MCGSDAGAIEVRPIEVGVLGLNNGRGRRWSVCGSNAGAIEVGPIEVGGLGVEQQEGPAVECVSFKSKFRPRGTDIEVGRHQNRGLEGSSAGLEAS